MKPLAWSYSRLNDFEKCARMFQGKHVAKDFPKENFDSPHLIRGKDIHAELERAVTKGTPLHPTRQWLQPVVNAIRSQSLILVEKQMCLDVRHRQVSWFNTDRAWCRVIFDVACTNDEQLIVIIDWKTGKVRHENTDQLRLFAGAAFDQFPEAQRVLTAYVWADHPTEKMTVKEYTRDQYVHIWEEFGDRAELINLAQESGNWPATPGFYCKFCPARLDQCEYKK